MKEERGGMLAKTGRVLGISAATIASVILIPTPASAHGAYLELPDGRGAGFVSADHTIVWAADDRADGWGVRTYALDSKNQKHTIGDANGSQDGFGWKNAPAGRTWKYIQVCTGPNGANYRCNPTNTWAVA